MATLLQNKKAGIVGVILDVVIAAIFVLMAATFISDILGSFISCTGQLEDVSKAVCLGNGDGRMVCVDKDSGVERFSCEAGSKWQARSASSLPKLEWLAPEQEGVLPTGNIYFGLGDHFCAYDWKGENKWGFNACADLSDVAIPTGSDVNDDVVCFGNGGSHAVYCLDKKTSEVKLKVHAPPGSGDAKSTPALNKEGDVSYAYFGLGVNFYKYATSAGSVGDAPSNSIRQIDFTLSGDARNKTTGIALGTDKKLACLGGGAEHTAYCFDENFGIMLKSHGSWSDCPINMFEKYEAQCKANADPIIFGNYTFVSLGNRICKYDSGKFPIVNDENGAAAISCTPRLGDIIYPETTYDVLQAYYSEIKGVSVGSGFVCAAIDLEVFCFTDSLNSDMPVFSAKISGVNVDLDRKVTCKGRESCKSKGQPVISGGNLYFTLGDLLCSYPVSSFGADKSVEISNEDDKSDGRNWCVDVSDKQIQTGVAALPQLEIIETGPASVLTKTGKADVDIYAITNIPAKCRYSRPDEGKTEYSDMSAKTEKPANAAHKWTEQNLAVGSYQYNFACKSDKVPNTATGTVTVAVSQQACQTDLSLENPQVYYEFDDVQADQDDFKINKKFKAYIDLKSKNPDGSQNADCTGPVDVRFYGKTPTTNEMEIVVNPPPWTGRNADTRLAYPNAIGAYAQLPNHGAGTYTLKFSLSIDAAKINDADAANNVNVISLTVK